MTRKYPRPKIGDRYGEWTVLSVPIGRVAGTKLLCRCACGCERNVVSGNLVNGHSTRCRSCAGKQTSRTGWAVRYANGVPYGFIPLVHRVRLRARVHTAVYRCHNSRNAGYKDYGGRGISVYPAWQKDRTLFARYLMTLPGWDDPNLTMDRINNDGNYEPGNIRFVTMAVNCRNRRSA